MSSDQHLESGMAKIADSGLSASSSRASGAMFFSVFGTAWLIWWCLETYGASFRELAAILAGGGFLFFLSLWMRLRRVSDEGSRSAEHIGTRRKLVAINVIQWVAIVITVNTLANSDHRVWLAAAIIVIVGLHFLPLALIFQYRVHYITGLALILLGVVYPFVAVGGPASAVGPLGAGIILWLSAIGALFTSVRAMPAKSI